MQSIKDKLNDLPDLPGVYIMKSEVGEILYIGKAKNLKNRVRQYFSNSIKTIKVQFLVSKIFTFDYIITPNEIEALVLENNLIKKNKPPYNILLKDDKSYPYLKIDLKQTFPRPIITRKLLSDGAKYFGPYMQGISINELLDIICSAFNIRTCNLDFESIPKNHRPCLNYHIKRCNAPCADMISKEHYRQIINEVIQFLNGNDKEVYNMIKNKMILASEEENYELAIFYRDRLNMLDKIISKQISAMPKDFNLDVFAISGNGVNMAVSQLIVRAGKLLGSNKEMIPKGYLSDETALSEYIMSYYSDGRVVADEIVVNIDFEDKNILEEYFYKQNERKINIVKPIQGLRKQLIDMSLSNAVDFLEKAISIEERKENLTVGGVAQLQASLSLKKLPLRMECYDISHISGTDMVGSMVVFNNGEMDKKHYRKFRIKTVEGNNDFECMAEILTRRFNRFLEGEDASFSKLPDLIVIDGGKGQLSYAVSVLNKFNLDVEIISLAKREEEVFLPNNTTSIMLSKNSYALKLIQRLRDETHRFAITFHRSLRSKRQTKSVLEDIPKCGTQRIKILYKHFKTLENIKNASIEELQSVKGVPKTLAVDIYNFFHK